MNSIYLLAFIVAVSDSPNAKVSSTNRSSPSGPSDTSNHAPEYTTCSEDLSPYYAQSAWPRVHRDSRNSDYAPVAASPVNRVQWTALDGAAVLAHPSIGPQGQIYVTTGQGPGTRHLHAFDRNGLVLWESDPQTSLDDLDSGAVYSVPLVDSDGDIYLSDINQFWAFRSDGSVKWKVVLPDPDGFMASAVLTREGYVGGITIHGKIVFFHREDGSTALPVFELPSGLGPQGPPTPAGLWDDGLVDPAIRELVYKVTFGYELEVTNTPAVHPQTGRLFITAAGESPANGVLYGLDVVDGVFHIAFAAPMTGGSGTSPSLAPDGSAVYAVGGDQVLVAFDAETGKLLWRAQGAGAAAAPAIGPDGTIYSGGGENLIAIHPADGSIKWSANYDSLARTLLPSLRPKPLIVTSSDPRARTNGVVSISAGHLWIPLVMGYELSLPGSETSIIQPRFVALAAISPVNGKLVHATLLRDTCEATVAIGSDGSIFVRHAAILSSIYFYQLNPLVPARFDISGPPPAGLSVLEPASFASHALEGIRWADGLAEQAAASLSNEFNDAAATQLCLAGEQVLASADTIEKRTKLELRENAASTAIASLQVGARQLMLAGQFVASDPKQAMAAIAAARDAFQKAISDLELGQLVVIDVQPGQRDGSLSRSPRRRETVRVAIIKTPGALNDRIDPTTVALARVDTVGSPVRPLQRRGEPLIQLEDVGAPTLEAVCATNRSGPDGTKDMVLVFSAREIVEGLQLQSFEPGFRIPLALTGKLVDGTEFYAVDCVTIGADHRR